MIKKEDIDYEKKKMNIPLDYYAKEFTKKGLLELKKVDSKLLLRKALNSYRRKHGCSYCGKSRPEIILELKYYHNSEKNITDIIRGHYCSFDCFREYLITKKDIEDRNMIFDNILHFACILGRNFSLKELKKINFQQIINRWIKKKR